MKIQKFATDDKVILINGQHGIIKGIAEGTNPNYYNIYIAYDNATVKVFAADMTKEDN